MMPMPARIGLVVLSAAAVVWLAVLLHGASLREDGQAIALRPPARLSDADVARATSLLEHAAQRTPDTEPEIDEAALLIRVRKTARARALLESVVSRAEHWAGTTGTLTMAPAAQDR